MKKYWQEKNSFAVGFLWRDGFTQLGKVTWLTRSFGIDLSQQMEKNCGDHNQLNTHLFVVGQKS